MPTMSSCITTSGEPWRSTGHLLVPVQAERSEKKNGNYHKKSKITSKRRNSAENSQREDYTENQSITAKMAAAAVASPRPRSLSPRMKTPRGRIPQATPEYDARLDRHQQTYVLSPRVMRTLTKTMRESGGVFTAPADKIGFHGPRRPLLLSYPVAPTPVGRAMFVRTYRRAASASPERRSSLPECKESKENLKLAYNMRTCESKGDHPAPKKLPRPKTVPPPQTKTEKLAKEKGFVLDGIALSSIQDDFAKVQPKLGPAIPPYNSHYDPHVRSYFTYKGLHETLIKTGQTRNNSESIQGKYVDKFHYIGVGHDYMSRRNKAGAGYSRELVNGHGQFLTEIRPMDGYNGKYGFRRNTPILRYCPSPFGTASRSSTF